MLLALVSDPDALADPLAWMELLGWLSPTTRRLLSLVLLLPPATIAALTGMAASQLGLLYGVLAGGLAGAFTPWLALLVMIHLAARRRSRS